MVVAGIDEAGRGPVVGPMVLAIVAGNEKALRALGVRDSKELSRKARERLYPLILKSAECVNYVVLEPHVIDEWAASHKLNLLEAEEAAKLMRLCDADVYYVDSPDPKPERFSELLSRMSGRRVVAMNKAERVPQVAAASIVAKVVRDRLVDMLRSEMGDFGSGYPSDSKTISALRSGKIAVECIRHSWGTLKRLKGDGQSMVQ
ncbi:ribonuclease HII [Thermoproteus uzoniensis 768-20]|uniref:Ribonuclease HII n=1 Tax=Thermoproteus uzoniensis (strain 768-20) TaxID=999630 RepID=F2L5E3_THEU7|nr:ribonuclease HII [Thermoproteus uzoniensis]AEA13568.1 ribonuclease HII [Thermoproteus uzoniensis 768-20]